MPVLTPSERRGALMLLALCALGAAWDLLHLRPAAAPPAASLSPVVTAPPATSTEDARTATGPPPAPLDLNRASAAELDALPGIGPVLALRIVEHRALAGAYRSPDELLAVRGIGPRLFAKLRPLVTTAGAPAAVRTDTVQIATSPGR